MADALRNYLSSSPWTCSLNYMMLWLTPKYIATKTAQIFPPR